MRDARVADPAPRDASPDPFDAFATPWRAIRQFLAARVVVGAVLCGYAAILPLQPWLIVARTRTGFLTLSVAYLALALVGAWQLRRPIAAARRVLGLHIVLDLALLTGLLGLAGGLPSGLAILLILPNAAAAILLGTRQALGFAAVSSLLILALTTYDWWVGHLDDAVMAQAGIMGTALMATALAVGWLAGRLRNQEHITRARDRELKSQFETMRQVIEGMPDGVIVLDASNTPITANRAAQRMLIGTEADPAGFTTGVPDAGSVRSLLPAIAALRNRRAMPSAASEPLTALQGRPATGIAATITRADGSVQNVRLRALQGTADQRDLVVVLEDVARLDELAQQLKLAAMGRLSASIAHEIRNPLSAIRHANGLMRERFEDNALIRLSRIIEDNSLRIDRIIEDVLSVSRRGAPALEDLDPAQFLPAVVSDVCVPAGIDPLRIDLQLHSNAPIRFDAGHLRQVLLNLMANALRHASPARGAVRVSWSMGVKGPVLAVSDDGPGVPGDRLAHLFEPFMTTERTGTGLGLHLARELCLANGARIRYSPPGDNTDPRGAFLIEPVLT